MAESIKNRKVNLRKILDEIADDEDFTEEERKAARAEIQRIGQEKGKEINCA